MKAEARELYVHTKNNYMEALENIRPTCIAPLIAVRCVVRMAMDAYIAEYCTKGENPFSSEDFQSVSNEIYQEIKDGEL